MIGCRHISAYRWLCVTQWNLLTARTPFQISNNLTSLRLGQSLVQHRQFMCLQKKCSMQCCVKSSVPVLFQNVTAHWRGHVRPLLLLSCDMQHLSLRCRVLSRSSYGQFLCYFCQHPYCHSGQTKTSKGCTNTASKLNTEEKCTKQCTYNFTDMKKDGILTVPNVLTMCRMLMAPALGYLVLTDAYMMACVIFVIAGVTDVLDGFIARHFANQTSALGSFIDPLADKLLVSILFISLTYVNLIPVMLTALVIFRDICLMSAGFYIRYISLPTPRSFKKYFDLTNPSAKLQPTIVSKWNTAIQLSLVAFTLASPVFGYVDHPAMHALWYLTATTTLVSGIGYIFAKDTFKLLQQTRKMTS